MLKQAGETLHLDHFFGLWTFRALRHFKLDLLTLFESLEAFALNGAVVDEDVRRARLFNKTIALRVVKPLDLAGYSRHETNPPNDSVKRARELFGSFRADQLMLVSRGRFQEALHGNTQSTKTAWQKAHNSAIHHAEKGAKTELLITVKLADRNAGT
jgi:hypothetical protein